MGGYMTGIDTTANAWGYEQESPAAGQQQQAAGQQQQASANSYTDAAGNVWTRYDATFWWCAATQQYYNEQYQLNFDPASQMYYDDYGSSWSIQETDAYYAGN